MKVFISSLIGEYEDFRAAAVEAVETLGHRAVKAEDFPVSPGTPQQACLAAVRESDVVVLLLGERYGYEQPSRLSATHEEYREARERVPVLVFVQDLSVCEEAQQAFLDEVQAWSTKTLGWVSVTPNLMFRAARLRRVHGPIRLAHSSVSDLANAYPRRR